MHRRFLLHPGFRLVQPRTLRACAGERATPEILGMTIGALARYKGVNGETQVLTAISCKRVRTKSQI